jgi:hypothetical protein
MFQKIGFATPPEGIVESVLNRALTAQVLGAASRRHPMPLKGDTPALRFPASLPQNTGFIQNG